MFDTFADQFLQNVWYAAAWTDEISRELVPRTIAGIPLVLYRTEDGVPLALHDRCPHRFASLSAGSLEGDVLSCGYHGLGFDAAGTCVRNPHSPVIPAGARVRAYRAVERHGLVWIWPGAPLSADTSTIPDFSFIDDRQAWRCVSGTSWLNASFGLAIDNLMDLSHVEFLHRGLFGSTVKCEQSVREGDGFVETEWSGQDLPNIPIVELTGVRPMHGALTDQWTIMRWYPPGTMRLETGVVPAGRPRSEGLVTMAAHIVTPETQRTSHYFWNNGRSNDKESAEVDAALLANLRSVFDQQDKPMIEAVQRNMGAETNPLELGAVMLSPDMAAIRVRRLLAKMLATECERRDAVLSGGIRTQQAAHSNLVSNLEMVPELLR